MAIKMLRFVRIFPHWPWTLSAIHKADFFMFIFPPSPQVDFRLRHQNMAHLIFFHSKAAVWLSSYGIPADKAYRFSCNLSTFVCSVYIHVKRRIWQHQLGGLLNSRQQHNFCFIIIYCTICKLLFLHNRYISILGFKDVPASFLFNQKFKFRLNCV